MFLPLNPSHFWPEIPLLSKLFLLFLCAVSVYVLISLVRVLFRLLSLKHLYPLQPLPPVPRLQLTALQHRMSNLRQLLWFAFWLFTVCFLGQIPAAFNVIGDSRVPIVNIILLQLATFIEYATDVFLLFLLLHTLQRIVSARVLAFIRRQGLS